MSQTISQPPEHQAATAAEPRGTREVPCSLCLAAPGEPCQRSPRGDHLVRLVAAVKAGLLTRADLAAVVGVLVVIADHVVILERRAACWYCDRTGLPLEPCCDHRSGNLVCADRAECSDFVLAQLAETRQA